MCVSICIWLWDAPGAPAVGRTHELPGLFLLVGQQDNYHREYPPGLRTIQILRELSLVEETALKNRLQLAHGHTVRSQSYSQYAVSEGLIYINKYLWNSSWNGGGWIHTLPFQLEFHKYLLPNLPDKNTECPVTFAFQVNQQQTAILWIYFY